MAEADHGLLSERTFGRVELETGLLDGDEDLTQMLQMILHVAVGDEDVIEVADHMLNRETTQHKLHEGTEAGWGVLGSHWGNQVLQMHGLCREGKELPILRRNWYLPKAFGQIQRSEELRVLEPLDGVFNTRQWVDNLIAAFIDLTEIGEESPAPIFLLRKKDGGGVRAC